MKHLAKELRHARPSLRLAAPMSFWFIGLMGVFNLLLGTFLYLVFKGGVEDKYLHIVTAVIPIKVWAVAFVLLGVAKLYAIKVNSWVWARRTLLIGVGMKSGWAIALIFKTLSQPDNAFLTMLWLTVAITQFLCYVFFLPPHIMKPKGA